MAATLILNLLILFVCGLILAVIADQSMIPRFEYQTTKSYSVWGPHMKEINPKPAVVRGRGRRLT